MSDVTFTERELLKGCVSGDEKSWNLFFKHYNKLIYHTIYITLRVKGIPTNKDYINERIDELLLLMKSEKEIVDNSFGDWDKVESYLFKSKSTMKVLRKYINFLKNNF